MRRFYPKKKVSVGGSKGFLNTINLKAFPLAGSPKSPGPPTPTLPPPGGEVPFHGRPKKAPSCQGCEKRLQFFALNTVETGVRIFFKFTENTCMEPKKTDHEICAKRRARESGGESEAPEKDLKAPCEVGGG